MNNRKPSISSQSSASVTASTSSSVRRRAPPAVRGASRLTPRASNPHLSLVFAQGDAAIPIAPVSLRRIVSGASPSEDALTKHLDRDMGGERMGLRSRRSSSTTIRSMRTESGAGLAVNGGSVINSARSDSYPNPVLHEEDEIEPEAGPSRLVVPSGLSDDDGMREHNLEDQTTPKPNRRLNPKSSSSWLRWASPAPSFPKAKEKGKAKAEETLDRISTDSSRTIEIANLPQPSVAPQAPVPDIALDSTPISLGPEPVPAPQVAEEQPPPHLPSLEPPAILAPPDGLIPIMAIPRKGWRSYIWGSSEKTAEAEVESTIVTEDTESGLVEPPNGPEHVENGYDVLPVTNGTSTPASKDHTTHITMEDSMAQVDRDLPSSETTEIVNPVNSPNNQQPQGWSSYLVSFVIPPPKAQPPSVLNAALSNELESDTIVEPSDPVADQKPAPSEEPPEELVEDVPPQPGTAVESGSLAVPTPSVSPPQVKLAHSASSSGWLNYLASRARTKKITASSVLTAEAEGRKSSDTVEVMDFEGDPDFPIASTSKDLKDVQTKGDGKDTKPRSMDTSKYNGESAKDAKDSKAVPAAQHLKHKTSQNLSVRQKRLSNASIRSNGSLTQMSASDTTSSIKANSALPPPPQAPSKQPNLVIPSFDTTFDRPPRSLLPRTPSGVAAATSGLAWRALGAVGSYVYGESKMTNGEYETRGKKEGRDVGADLPRRLGLGSGSPDDGWKNVRRVVVVGVHGWFPAKMLTSVIGEPTGTSLKFATMMGEAVKQFFNEKGVDERDIRLTLIPLEGEGTIEHRVDKLYKAYLSNPAWINDLRRADAIFFAAHSQGCIVTTHLISRMIAQGHIRTPLNRDAVARCEWGFGPVGIVPQEDSRRSRNRVANLAGAEGGRQKVAMLAMCGVHLGPLYSISTSSVIQPYLQWFENAAARELFEFQDTSSAVSQAYQRALAMVLENEVRMVLLSSLNDQVVPIYGSSFSAATHPLLLRALFVDGASYSASDFMTNLLCFAFMLRNAGIDDERLVEHLSEATAGSLTGVGHSSPYEELGCYSIAVQYLFHAGPAAHPLPPLHVEAFAARDARNDFELPWIMRAIVDAAEVKDLFPGELRDLRDGILHWKPQTKALKEIRKRLEPMAGRQSRLRPLPTSPSSVSIASIGTGTGAELGTSPGATKNVPTKALPAGKGPRSRL